MEEDDGESAEPSKDHFYANRRQLTILFGCFLFSLLIHNSSQFSLVVLFGADEI